MQLLLQRYFFGRSAEGEEIVKNKELIYWLWLSLSCRPGSALPSTLLKFFGSPKKIYEADEEDFAE